MKLLDYGTLGTHASKTLTADGILALLDCAHSSIESLQWADLWVNFKEERSYYGSTILANFRVDKFQKYSIKVLRDLDIVKNFAS